jgi:hypothetical protein
LVEKAREWPGVHAVRALLDEGPLEGLWFDRTQEYSARRRGEEHERNRFATPEAVTLSPLPCWEHLSPESRKERVAEFVREIEEEAAAQRKATGKTVLGRAAILKQHPHERPNRPKKSYAPLVHAASRKVRLALYEGYRAFVAAYREAAEKLKAGHRCQPLRAGLSRELNHERGLSRDHLPPWPAACGLSVPAAGGRGEERSDRTGRSGSAVDFAADGRPIGLEVTAPDKVSAAPINRVLSDLGLSPLPEADLAPLRAA